MDPSPPTAYPDRPPAQQPPSLRSVQDGLLSLSEFTRGLAESVKIQEAVRSGRDDDEVVLRLQVRSAMIGELQDFATVCVPCFAL